MKTIRDFWRTCRQRGVVPTRHLLTVNIAKQETTLWERDNEYMPPFRWVKTYRCSTSKYGIGEKAGSNMTPRGLHRVYKKVGGGWPVGAALKNRQLIGFTWKDQPMTPIAHRIFWLEGLEQGFNRGEGIDTRERYIYIHGTGNEPTIGRPDSHGCVHLSANDLLPLYDKLPEGTLVWIAER